MLGTHQAVLHRLNQFTYSWGVVGPRSCNDSGSSSAKGMPWVTKQTLVRLWPCLFTFSVPERHHGQSCSGWVHAVASWLEGTTGSGDSVSACKRSPWGSPEESISLDGSAMVGTGTQLSSSSVEDSSSHEKLGGGGRSMTPPPLLGFPWKWHCHVNNTSVFLFPRCLSLEQWWAIGASCGIPPSLLWAWQFKLLFLCWWKRKKRLLLTI